MNVRYPAKADVRLEVLNWYKVPKADAQLPKNG